MATIKYFTKGKGNPTTIYLRFIHGRKMDFKRSTSLLVNPKYWNQETGTVRNVAEFKDKLNVSNKLRGLENHLLTTFNNSYENGEIIDSDWISNTIKSFFNQTEETDLNYFTEYAEYFHTNLNNKVQANGKTGVTIATFKKYRTIINKIKAFEKHKRKRVKLTDVGLKFHKDFIHYLHNVEKLNYNTTGKYLVFVKTICLDAKKYGLKINKDIENGEFRPTKQKVSFVTLNETEIQSIYDLDLTERPYLENARKWLIIGVWCGARVSDLLNFTSDNISNGFIEYTAIKTGQRIVLPLHPQVKEILKENNGEFPRKITGQRFNDYIKIVCELSKINEIVKGSKLVDINNEELKPGAKKKRSIWRKINGEFPKFDLVSSHICRRSFATNHYGKLPTPVIMAVTGHTTEKVFLSYIGKTATDNAETLKQFWNVQEQKRAQEKPDFKVIKTGS
ncbi:phage integrase SAM-like domain-containing protein [Formosa algae]|uniref:phage integrase SAM-like domain-containing protein n=1 Tax=Formosa algae TaxID=225843 RepID=UPI000CCFC9F2|nr:phage integrase SAM-like domain-containing protein [Formosa algae]PNW27416.1 hypothetical protein BKP44_13385 [Formosa algae]